MNVCGYGISMKKFGFGKIRNVESSPEWPFRSLALVLKAKKLRIEGFIRRQSLGLAPSGEIAGTQKRLAIHTVYM